MVYKIVYIFEKWPPSLAARLVGVSDGTVAVVLAWDAEPRKDVPSAECFE